MYQILIKYQNSKLNLWEESGTYTTKNDKTEFIKFETDDEEILKSEILRLDAIYGFENIKVIKIIDIDFDVKINQSEDGNNENEDNQ